MKTKIKVGDQVSWTVNPYRGEKFTAFGEVKSVMAGKIQIIIDLALTPQYAEWFPNRKTTCVSPHNVTVLK